MKWSKPFMFVAAGLTWTVFSLGLAVETAFAHGGATLSVSPTEVTPGGQITVTAEGVEAGEEFTITLEGVSYQATLGSVTVGDDEDFHQTYVVPTDAPPGDYQVRATSGEGEVITAELSILSSELGVQSQPPAKPSAAPMQLDRTKPPIEVAIIMVGILLSAGGGVLLVRRRESDSSLH